MHAWWTYGAVAVELAGGPGDLWTLAGRMSGVSVIVEYLRGFAVCPPYAMLVVVVILLSRRHISSKHLSV